MTRTIKKYANRRLYDTSSSRYITLHDLKGLIVSGESVRIVDAKSRENITREVLLQLVAEQESLALGAEIQSSTDIAPWCFSVSAGGETGWPATDWIEDLVLRQSGPEVYDQWVDGEIDFSDPRIERAFETFDQLVLAQGRVLGGRSEVLEVEVARAGDGLFTSEPGCAMFKQASFATSWFPDGTSIGPSGDVDFFILPDEEPDATDPYATPDAPGPDATEDLEIADPEMIAAIERRKSAPPDEDGCGGDEDRDPA